MTNDRAKRFWAAPPHIQDDLIRQWMNEDAGLTLCNHCEGTGNEFYSMYRACPRCDGAGNTARIKLTEPSGELLQLLNEREERSNEAMKP